MSYAFYKISFERSCTQVKSRRAKQKHVLTCMITNYKMYFRLVSYFSISYMIKNDKLQEDTYTGMSNI